ncbi:MAG: putative Nickel/cobalt efflux system RcnA [Gemmatimonadetes bacterium]|nr:putative Nickel/cobalt efflux system RcnA [Gemmatimonadota bacterium]
MDPWLTLGTASALGLLHALELDHMVAVSAFVAQRPSPRAAAGFGARWGIGHSAAVLLAGGALLASGLRLPARFDVYGEAAVGVMLIAVGAWAFVSARRMHLHPPPEHGDHAHLHMHHDHDQPHTHTHAHPHPHTHPHDDGHELGKGITVVGLMHGLAGTSGVVVLVPVTLMHSTAFGLGYLAAFGVGVTVAMSCYAMVAATAIRGATRRSLERARQLAMGVGVAGAVVGLWWVVRAAQS